MQKHLPERVMTSREFNQDLAKAKRLANEGPLIVTDRGKPAYVLITYEGYQRRLLTEQRVTLFDLIGQTGPESDFEFEPPRLGDDMGLRIPDFSED